MFDLFTGEAAATPDDLVDAVAVAVEYFFQRGERLFSTATDLVGSLENDRVFADDVIVDAVLELEPPLALDEGFDRADDGFEILRFGRRWCTRATRRVG